MTSDTQTRARDAGLFMSMKELHEADIIEPKWVIPGIIPEGLTLLAGAPKVGKSWLCLQLATSVAKGGYAFGELKVEQGEALYLALEDTAQRVKARSQKIITDGDFPDELKIALEFPRIPQAIDYLEDLISDMPDIRVLFVDVLQSIRPVDSVGTNIYQVEYRVMSELKKLADKHRIGVVAVHHTNKHSGNGDPLTEVSGSAAMTGAADTILVARRSRNTGEATLAVSGRDVEEWDYTLTWSPNIYSWVLSTEDAVEADGSATGA